MHDHGTHMHFDEYFCFPKIVLLLCEFIETFLNLMSLKWKIQSRTAQVLLRNLAKIEF
jgi:hypothetical protein